MKVVCDVCGKYKDENDCVEITGIGFMCDTVKNPNCHHVPQKIVKPVQITVMTYRIDTPRGSVDLFSTDKEHCLGLWNRFYKQIDGSKFIEITTTREEKVLEEAAV